MSVCTVDGQRFSQVIYTKVQGFTPGNGKGMFLCYTVKKRLTIFPSLPTGIIKLSPSRESLVSDIPAGDGKMANRFLQCTL
jgi:hypothetical protein